MCDFSDLEPSIRWSVPTCGNRRRISRPGTHDYRTVGRDPVPDSGGPVTDRAGIVAQSSRPVSAGFIRRQDVIVLRAVLRPAPRRTVVGENRSQPRDVGLAVVLEIWIPILEQVSALEFGQNQERPTPVVVVVPGRRQFVAAVVEVVDRDPDLLEVVFERSVDES